MKTLACILAALAAVLLVLLVGEHGAMDTLRVENAKLRAQLSDTSEKTLAAAKVACAARAEAEFRALGYSENGGGGASGLDSETYSNHYNPALKRCLMVLVGTSYQSAKETIIQSMFDVDERADFGDYGWVSSDTKKYWEQRPIQCQMTPPGKPEAFCHSTDEWDTYVKSLMG